MLTTGFWMFSPHLPLAPPVGRGYFWSLLKGRADCYDPGSWSTGVRSPFVLVRGGGWNVTEPCLAAASTPLFSSPKGLDLYGCAH